MQHVAARLLFGLSLAFAACSPGGQPAAKPTEAGQPAAPAAAPAAPAGGLVFSSTQFRPIEEAEKMRQVILRGAPVGSEFLPEDTGPFTDRIAAEAKAGRVTVS